jgi:hypothetical protein
VGRGSRISLDAGVDPLDEQKLRQMIATYHMFGLQDLPDA